MIKYQTKQRKYLLDFFLKHSDEQFTVNSISKLVGCISISSIYRNVNQMFRDGLLHRFQKEGITNFFYCSIGSQGCKEHLHLKCCNCGSIVHIPNVFSDKLADMINKNTNFNLDKSATMLFGYCKSCEK